MLESFNFLPSLPANLFSSISATLPTPPPIFHYRPSWNAAFISVVKTLHLAAFAVPRDVNMIRFITDHEIPSWLPTLSPGVTFTKTTVGIIGEWYYESDGLEKKSKNLTNDETIREIRKLLTTKNLIMYIHGGAFCLCSSGTHRGLLYRLVSTTKSVVYSVDYHRPPEYPYPVPLEDCFTAYMHLLNLVGGDSSKIILAGDSAGGNLVISLMLALIENNLPLPKGAILLSPWVDLTDCMKTPRLESSWKVNRKYDFISKSLAAMFAKYYLGESTIAQHQFLFPEFQPADPPQALPPPIDGASMLLLTKTKSLEELMVEEYTDELEEAQRLAVGEVEVKKKQHEETKSMLATSLLACCTVEECMDMEEKEKTAVIFQSSSSSSATATAATAADAGAEATNNAATSNIEDRMMKRGEESIATAAASTEVITSEEITSVSIETIDDVHDVVHSTTTIHNSLEIINEESGENPYASAHAKGFLTLRDLSPLYAKEELLKQLPPMMIAYGEAEVLRDQIQHFCDLIQLIEMQQLGGSCEETKKIKVIEKKDMIHVYPMFHPTGMQACEDFFDEVKDFLSDLYPPTTELD